MRGSVAIWHDSIEDNADGYAPRAEIHVNIWRGERKKNNANRFDLFDIGFRFEEVRSISTLSISLPFAIEATRIHDLFDTMHDSSMLSTIFNETLAAGELRDNAHVFSASDVDRSQVLFYVSRCPTDEIRLSNVADGDNACTIMTIGDRFFNKIRERVGDHYVRLRFEIPIGFENGFISTVNPKDSAFISTVSTTEVIEFRLNERRNFPIAIRERLKNGRCQLINISSIHYFLIRDMNVEMTQSHTSFRKMRRLEPEMWDKYLGTASGFDPKNMIIYQWSSTSQNKSYNVESFTALATFKSYYTGSLLAYAAVIVGLGALGSAMQATGATFVSLPLSFADGLFTAVCGSEVAACKTISSNVIFTSILFYVIYRVVIKRQKNL